MESYAKASPDLKPQPDKFRDLARQLGCDEDEKAFEEKVKRVADATPDRPGKPEPADD